jgi:UDP-N-acetylmuramoylalanine--D-glutamate ligase
LRVVQSHDLEIAVKEQVLGPTTGTFSVQGRDVVVVGAARSGIAAAELLVERGAHVTLSEQRDEIAEASSLVERGVGLELGGHQVGTFERADLIVLSPGVPPEQPAIRAARDRGVPVIAEIELASRWLKGRVIAITGTKGKSTTTTLTGKILEGAGFDVTVGGNIGAPLSAQVDRSTPSTLHVVETSSFQLEGIVNFRPWISVLLNVSPDHLDRHPNVEAYVNAKARIFENQQQDDWAVVNADDPIVLDLARNLRARRRQFARHTSLDKGTVIESGWIVKREDHQREPLVPLSAIHLLGPHLISDVMAAATVGAIAGATPRVMTSAVEEFRGLEHAMELVVESGGVRFVNDSKATNVDSALHSIESFDGGLVAIIGGRFKGGDLGLLREPLRSRAVAVVAIGEARPLLRKMLAEAVPIHDAASMDEAVDTAFRLARPSGVVLLAPACASFDMFRDYAERGRKFKEAVRKLVV